MLVTAGSDGALVKALEETFTKAGALVEYVAPAAGPLKLKGGRRLTPDHAVVGAPSVLFDAAGVTPDDGCPELTADSVAEFVEQCAALRHWERPVRD